MKTLGTVLLEKIGRCKKLLCSYEEIGQSGAFGVIMIRLEIERAEKAIGQNDIVRMIATYKALKECQ